MIAEIIRIEKVRKSCSSRVNEAEGLEQLIHSLVTSAAAIAVLTLSCFLGLGLSSGRATELWESSLSTMPLANQVTELNSTNCIAAMLNALRSNYLVKGLVFMPGATDEFYFF